MTEKEHPSNIRSGKTPSVGGSSEWLGLERGHKEPIPPSASLKWLRSVITGEGAHSCLARLHTHPAFFSLEARGDPLKPAMPTCWGRSSDALTVASPLVQAWAGWTLNPRMLGSFCCRSPPHCHFSSLRGFPSPELTGRQEGE